MTTLTELRTHPNPKQLLLGMGDSDLDRVAAEVQGWHCKEGWPHGPIWFTDLGIYEPPVSHSAAQVDGQAGYYYPSRDLNQAYALLKKCPYPWSSDYDDEEGRMWSIDYIEAIERDGRKFNRLRTIQVLESEAGSHARAVTILAVLGLLGGKS